MPDPIDPKKARLIDRLVALGLRHGVYIVAFEDAGAMVEAMDNIRLGANLKAAMEEVVEEAEERDRGRLH